MFPFPDSLSTPDTPDPTAFRHLSGQKVYSIGLWSEPKNILDRQLEEISFETIKSFIYCISWINRWTQKSPKNHKSFWTDFLLWLTFVGWVLIIKIEIELIWNKNNCSEWYFTISQRQRLIITLVSLLL